MPNNNGYNFNSEDNFNGFQGNDGSFDNAIGGFSDNEMNGFNNNQYNPGQNGTFQNQQQFQYDQQFQNQGMQFQNQQQYQNYQSQGNYYQSQSQNPYQNQQYQNQFQQNQQEYRQQYQNFNNGYMNQPNRETKGSGFKKGIGIIILLLFLLGSGVALANKLGYINLGNIKQTEDSQKELNVVAQEENPYKQVIVGFNNIQKPVDENDKVVEPMFDEDGELIIPPIRKEVLDKLRITEEEYSNGDFNPFFEVAGKSGTEIVFDLDKNPIVKEDGSYLMKIKNREILLDPAGNPFLNSKGEVWYSDAPNAPSKEVIERETGLKFNILSSGENTEVKAVKEEYGYVNNLDSTFFDTKEDDSRIKETRWRDLKLIPGKESASYFIIYNNEGRLSPYEPTNYNNREVFGRVLSFDYFKTNLTYDLRPFNNKVNTNPSEDTIENVKVFPGIVMSITSDFDKTMLKSKVVINELKKKNWYPDLENRSADEIATNVAMYIRTNELQEKDFQEKAEIIDTYFVDKNTDPHLFFLNEKINEMENTLKKTGKRYPNTEQIAKLHYSLYKRNIAEEIDYLKSEACKEMNKTFDNSCKSSKDLSTLELRSDFIELTYKNAYAKSIKDLISILYTIDEKLSSE